MDSHLYNHASTQGSMRPRRGHTSFTLIFYKDGIPSGCSTTLITYVRTRQVRIFITMHQHREACDPVGVVHLLLGIFYKDASLQDAINYHNNV